MLLERRGLKPNPQPQTFNFYLSTKQNAIVLLKENPSDCLCFFLVVVMTSSCKARDFKDIVRSFVPTPSSLCYLTL